MRYYPSWANLGLQRACLDIGVLVELAETEYTIFEGGAPVNVCAVLRGVLTHFANLNLAFDVQYGTASGEMMSAVILMYVFYQSITYLQCIRAGSQYTYTPFDSNGHTTRV